MARERFSGQQNAAAVEQRLEKQALKHNSRLENLTTSIVRADETWGRATEPQRDDMIAALYQTEPFIYNWFAVRREYHDAIKEAEAFAQKKGHLTTDFATHFQQDIYSMTFQKTSLPAMEEMKPPLSVDEIRGINSLFKYRRKTPDAQQSMQTALTFLAVQPLAQPKTKAIPRNVEALHETITDYFDYYTQLLASTNLPIEDETQLQVTLMWHGQRLLDGIAGFLPARLGITPSSAEKLFHRKLALANPINRVYWKNLNSLFHFTEKLGRAYNPSDVPTALESFIHYDPEVDTAASQLLQEAYADRVKSPEDRFKVNDQKIALISDISRYRKDLRREILQNPQKIKRIQMPEDDVVQEVVISEIYKGNLIFALRFNQITYLTLDIDSQGVVYGIPPDLEKSYPYIEDLVLNDVLGEVSSSYPKAEIPVIKIPKQPIYVAAEKKVLNESSSSEAAPKRKRLKSLQQKVNTVFNREPSLPEAVREEKPKRIISYSEDEVRRYLGNRTDIDPILTALSRFEQGSKGLQNITDQDHLYRLRVGDFRVILKYHGEGKYSLVNIDNRRDVYKHL